MQLREFYEEKKKVLKQRLQKYCQKVYKRVLDKPVTQVNHNTSPLVS